MKKFQCTVCGSEFESDGNGEEGCPVCGAPKELLTEKEEESGPRRAEGMKKSGGVRYMSEIRQMADTGESIIGAMGTKKTVPSWDEITIIGAQLADMPLERDEEIDTATVIGRNAQKPLVSESPVFISHMSFGALSREAKIALAKGSAMSKTVMCSGEGGILPEEKAAAYKYIFEYVPNLYSVTPENLKSSDAVEIKIGQGAKPGLGGFLPGNKVTEEIAAVRGKPAGKDIHSPSKFSDINGKDDLKRLVGKLRTESGGRPIGIKLAAGNVEEDLEFCVYAEPDFITLDSGEGATGAVPELIRDATGIPAVYALYRARKYLDSVNSGISLIITGGLRVSSDFAKALAVGADAVAIATSALIAASCGQYRLCGSGKCPMGIATQDPELRKNFNIGEAAKRVANFLDVSLTELKFFARMTGHKSLREMNNRDLRTANREIYDFTAVPHA